MVSSKGKVWRDEDKRESECPNATFEVILRWEKYFLCISALSIIAQQQLSSFSCHTMRKVSFLGRVSQNSIRGRCSAGLQRDHVVFTSAPSSPY